MDLSELDQVAATLPRHPWELSRRAFVEDLTCRIQRRAHGGIRRVLDVGCGDGFVACRLASRFPQIRIDAVDTALTANSVEQILTRGRPWNLHLADSLEGVEGPGERIGLTLLLDVLEHTADDEAFLASLVSSGLQAPGAYFLIMVPAMPALFSSHDRLLGHHRRYGFEQIRRVAENAGLRVLEGGTCFLSGFWFRVMRCRLERLGWSAPLRRSEVSSWRRGRWLTRLCQAFLNADLAVSRLLAKTGLRIPGLSCYLICQKRG